MLIEPKILKGFRDSLPEIEIIRKDLIYKIEKILQGSGYVPIDTPALEYYEILTGKGGEETDKQIFHFMDAGNRKVGLRFDLTVPLARFVAKNQNSLIFPFKRYHIAKVWRGEKPQKGRFREFIQADFDIIGTNSILSDIEIIENVINIFNTLKIENIKIHINDRKLCSEIISKLNLLKYEKEIFKSFDKFYKIGETGVAELLQKTGISSDKVNQLIQIFKPYYNPDEFFSKLKSDLQILNNPLEKIIDIYKLRGLADKILIDLSITRGLDYYTGMVFETFIDDGKEYGSVCSGGRYENLTSIFSKTSFSGIGGSVGLDRLISYLIDKNKVNLKKSTTEILIINFSEEYLVHYLDFNLLFIKNDINSEIYLDSTHKLKKQFKYADKKGIKYCLILGENEIKQKKIKLKILVSGEEIEFNSIDGVINFIKLNKKK